MMLNHCKYFLVVTIFILLVSCEGVKIPTTDILQETSVQEITRNVSATLTLTPSDEANDVGVNTKSEEVSGLDLINLSKQTFQDVETYQALQDYSFEKSPLWSDGSYLVVNCVTDFQNKSSCCQSEFSQLEDGEISTILKSELIKQDNQFWFRGEDNQWEIISSFDARAPGLTDGEINPIPFLDIITDAHIVREIMNPDITLQEIAFTADIESFLYTLYGEEEGKDIYERGEDFYTSGTLWFGKEDDLLREYTFQLKMTIDGTKFTVWLTHTFSAFNESIVIPGISP